MTNKRKPQAQSPIQKMKTKIDSGKLSPARQAEMEKRLRFMIRSQNFGIGPKEPTKPKPKPKTRTTRRTKPTVKRKSSPKRKLTSPRKPTKRMGY